MLEYFKWCMGLRMHLLQPPLSQFVDVMWYSTDYRPLHAGERILPDGSVVLIINLREDRLRLHDTTDFNRFQTVRGAVVSGPQRRFHVIDTPCQEFTIGVRFKPGGAFPFFGLPADELCGCHLPLDELWGAGATELREQLLEADTPLDKFGILSHALMMRLRSVASPHPGVTFALKELGRASCSPGVAAVAAQIGLSHRRFVELFRAQAGLTPKLYCRIRRFHDVIRILHQTTRAVDWPDLALRCGYYDQAHFIHDFRAFSGLNPTSYLKHRGEYLNHVPLPP